MREAGGEIPGTRVGGGESELLDLRLHRPRPDVVIVRVSGQVDGLAARLLADRVGKQLHRAPHVVIDLNGVSVLGAGGVAVLCTLYQQALARGTRLHIVAAHASVRRPLHATGLAQLRSPESTADAVIAGLGPDHKQASIPRQTQRDHAHCVVTACVQQWQDAELAMNVARRCFEGWLQTGREEIPTSLATTHAFHTHEALHEALRAIALLTETLRIRSDDAGQHNTLAASTVVCASRE